MNRFKIIIEYDGFDYVGWQRQDNGISIQQAIERAAFKLTGEEIVLFGAGRTDAGVNALGQVAHFDLNKKMNIDNVRDGLNQYLRPHKIAILSAEQVDYNFHARFSAKKRTYEYIITNRRAPLTINKYKSWEVFKELDIQKIINEAKFFLGKHDLSAFRSINCQSNSPVKTIDEVLISQKERNIHIKIVAKSFLHSQVRIMVGTLVEIGKGKINKSINVIIDEKKRSQAGITAPAYGLYLVRVDY